MTKDINEESVHNGFVTGAFGIVFMGLSIVITFWAPATIVASFNLYHRWLESIAWVTGFGGIMNFFGVVFHGSTRQKVSSVLFAIAAITGLFLVIYMDYLRPELAIPGIFSDASIFEGFRLNIAIFEGITIILPLIGMIVTKVRINK
jgi:hypothetical protein